jgi:hypothetical protein
LPQSPILQPSSATKPISAEKLDTSRPAMDAHMKTVKLSSFAVEIAPVLADAISKCPSIHCEESQTEKPELKQHLQRHRRGVILIMSITNMTLTALELEKIVLLVMPQGKNLLTFLLELE